jgi:hypothetical protein
MTLFMRELRNSVALRNATLLRIPATSSEKQSTGRLPGALLPMFGVWPFFKSRCAGKRRHRRS